MTSTVYDHTSILRRVQQKWNLPSLTRRDAAAAAPLDALDLEGEPAFLTPRGCPHPAWRGAPRSGQFRGHGYGTAEVLHAGGRA